MTKGALSVLLLGLGLAAGQPAHAVNGSGISDPNDGINFHQIRFGYNY